MESTETVVHVVPYGNLWRVRVVGRAIFEVFRQKQNAIEHGIETAKEHVPSKLIVHREDGTVDRMHTYNSRS